MNGDSHINTRSIFFALVFSLALSLLDWFSGNFAFEIQDRASYIFHAAEYSNIFDSYFDRGIYYYFLNEPILNIFLRLSNIFIENPKYKIIFLIFLISFISIYIISYELKNKNYFLLLLCLLFPPFLTCFVQSIRLGMGLAVFLTAFYLFHSVILKRLSYLLCIFIHSAYFIIIPLLFLSHFFANYFLLRRFQRFFFFIFCGVIFYIALSGDLLESLGLPMRQIEGFSLAKPEGSGAGFLLVFVLILLILSAQRLTKTGFFAVMMGVFYCAGYFEFLPIARVGEATLIFLVIESILLSGKRKFFAITTIAIFEFLFYLKLLLSNNFI